MAEIHDADVTDFLESLDRIANYLESIAIDLHNQEERLLSRDEKNIPKFDVIPGTDEMKPYACSICGASISRSKFNDHEKWHEQHG